MLIPYNAHATLLCSLDQAIAKCNESIAFGTDHGMPETVRYWTMRRDEYSATLTWLRAQTPGFERLETALPESAFAGSKS